MILPYKHAKYITYPNVREKEYIITDQGTIIDLVYKRIVRYFLDKDGYMRVSLRVKENENGRPSMNFSIHRIVAWEFCENENPSVNNVVNHLDGIIMHNDSANLEWTTAAGNTQHANAHGLRKSCGEGNATSVYNEGFVRQVCKLYEQGYTPLDVYHKFYGYEPVRSKAEKSLYFLFYNLKKKVAWPHIASQYNYSIDIPRNQVEKVFRPNENSLFSEENVRWICEQLERNVPASEIATMIMESKMPNFTVGDHTRRNIREAVGRISRGDVWWNIVKEYNLPTIVYNRHADDTQFNEAFRQMIDEGKLQSTIVRDVSKEFSVSQNYVKFHLQKYLREHGFETKFNSYEKQS